MQVRQFGIIAAQSIGEPGTQLTMRTFPHGVCCRRMTLHKVFRVLKSFLKQESRKGLAIISDNKRYRCIKGNQEKA